MRFIIFLALLFAFYGAAITTAQSNVYLSSAKYEVRQVRPGDTVWQIAAQYVDSGDDIRDLVAAISQVNNLDRNARLSPGQVLKVPFK